MKKIQFRAKEYFEFYEAAHQNAMNRYIHHFAHSLAIVGVIILAFKPLVCLALIVLAFCLSWTGHYFFEKNTPAFFDTNELDGIRESTFHYVKVAVGGVVWTLVCFLRRFHPGPRAKK